MNNKGIIKIHNYVVNLVAYYWVKSWNMSKMTVEQRRRNMQSIRGKDTSIELLLRKELWRRGYRYRKNYRELPGKPDIVLTKYRIAIFCDGEFFHGKEWDFLEGRLKKGKNADFWIGKIKKNISRDDEVNKSLRYLGWTVIRFWGEDIEGNIEECIKTIEEAIISSQTEDTYDY